MCCAAHQEEDEGAGADSELDESESEAEVGAEDLKLTADSYSCASTADMATSGTSGCQKAPAKLSEEVGRWVTHTVNHFEMLHFHF